MLILIQNIPVTWFNFWVFFVIKASYQCAVEGSEFVDGVRLDISWWDHEAVWQEKKCYLVKKEKEIVSSFCLFGEGQHEHQRWMAFWWNKILLMGLCGWERWACLVFFPISRQCLDLWGWVKKLNGSIKKVRIVSVGGQPSLAGLRDTAWDKRVPVICP